MNENDMFSTHLNKALNEYGRELHTFWDKIPGGMSNPLELMALYSVLRWDKPKKVLEVGSLIGRTTAIINKALVMNDNGGEFTSCDLEDKSRVTKIHMSELFPKNKIKFIPGIVQNTVAQLDNDYDFVFIDGPHDAEFMKWCFDNILPKTVDKAIMAIHDINLSYDWNYRQTPGCETDLIVSMFVEGKLPVLKLGWMEDWCINHNFRDARNQLFKEMPVVGRWGVIDGPEYNSLSFWLKGHKDA